MKPRAKILVPVAVTAVGLAGALILVATRPELDVAAERDALTASDLALQHLRVLEEGAG